jgi:predicted lipoprotein with Yx(FWY)xxD motif
MRYVRIIVLAIAVGALLTGCSSETTGVPPGETSFSLSTTPSPATPSSSDTATPTAGVSLSSAKIQGLGTVLVEHGRTVYLFTNDTGAKSTCTGACATTWPALTTKGEPAAKAGADDSKLGTTDAVGGGQQVTYNGHPLYLYSGDEGPGEANGQGIGGVWFAVTPDGEPAGQGHG